MENVKIDYQITLNETNIIKGIAICAMLWHHLFLEHQEYGEFVFKLALTGKVCVALFIFLSGYGMAIQFKDVDFNGIYSNLANTVKFLFRRFLKFYLNYWVVFITSILLGVFVFGRTLRDAYGTESNLLVSFLRDILGFQFFNSYNVTWWFNGLILTLWVFFPILYWAIKSKFVCIWALALLFMNPVGVLNYLNPSISSIYMTIFALGICMATHTNEINKLLNHVNLKVVVVLLFMTTILFLYMRNHYVFSCFLMTKGDPFIAVSLSLAVVGLSRLFNWNMSGLAFVGKHSMNMYLIHTFIFGYFFHDFIYSFKYPIFIFTVLLIASLLLSIAIEFLKGKFGFYQFQKHVISKFEIQKKPLM